MLDIKDLTRDAPKILQKILHEGQHDRRTLKTPERDRRDDRESEIRRLYDRLKLWTACSDKRCKRARTCAGELGPDGSRCYRDLGGEDRAWLDALGTALRLGYSVQQAVSAGQHARRKYRSRKQMEALVRDVAKHVRVCIRQRQQRLRDGVL